MQFAPKICPKSTQFNNTVSFIRILFDNLFFNWKTDLSLKIAYALVIAKNFGLRIMKEYYHTLLKDCLNGLSTAFMDFL